jgi:hypothetical protein
LSDTELEAAAAEDAYFEQHTTEMHARRADLAAVAEELHNGIRRLHGNVGHLFEDMERGCARSCDECGTLNSIDEKDVITHLEQAARSLNAVRALIRPGATK